MNGALKPDTLFSAAVIFDKVVVPNELCAKRFRPFMDDQAIAVLGSARYCDEWLGKLAHLSPLPDFLKAHAVGSKLSCS